MLIYAIIALIICAVTVVVAVQQLPYIFSIIFALGIMAIITAITKAIER